MKLRKNEEEKLKELYLGDVTSVNLTLINGGIQQNIIAPEINFLFDVRLAIDVDPDDFEKQVRQIIDNY